MHINMSYYIVQGLRGIAQRLLAEEERKQAKSPKTQKQQQDPSTRVSTKGNYICMYVYLLFCMRNVD